MKNKLIIDAEATFVGKIPREEKGAYHRIDDAGMKILFGKNKQGVSMLDDNGDGEFELEEGQDPIKIAVDGAIGLLRILQKESKDRLQLSAITYAGQSLLMDILDFMEQGGVITVDAETLANATTLYAETLMPKLGLSPDKVKAMTEQAQGVMDDPQKMAQYQQSQQQGGEQAEPPAEPTQPAQPPMGGQPPTGLIGAR